MQPIAAQKVGYTHLLEQDLRDLVAGTVNPSVKQGAVNFLTGSTLTVETEVAPVRTTFAYTQLTSDDIQALAEGVVSDDVREGALRMLEFLK